MNNTTMNQYCNVDYVQNSRSKQLIGTFKQTGVI